MKGQTAAAKEASYRPLEEALPRLLESAMLLMGAREVHIAHAGETYRLTVTRQGKLILTK